MRILVAEDHPRIAAAVARGLRREGMAVDVAPDGAAALYKARINPYDVVVLDRDLPEVHGDDVCRALTAEQPRTKVLMLTAARSTDELVQGLALGADDYLSKPFRFAELVARLRALGRRTGEARPPVLSAGDVVLDPSRADRDAAPARTSSSRPRSSRSWRRCWRPRAPSSRPRRCSSARGTRCSTRFRNTVRMTVMALRRKLGEPAADRDGPRERLPRVIPNLRVRLTAIYGGIFFVFVAVLLGVSYWLMARHLRPHARRRSRPPTRWPSSARSTCSRWPARRSSPARSAGRSRGASCARCRAPSTPASASWPTPRTSCARPLTVIRTEADVTLANPDADVAELRAMGREVVDAVDEMDALLDGLMVLARSGRGLPGLESVDLAAAAGAAARRVRSGGVRVRLDLEPAGVRGERRLLERLAANLIENGVRYNAPGGFVSVRRVSDDGRGARRRQQRARCRSRRRGAA